MSESFMTGGMFQPPEQDKHTLHLFTSKQIFEQIKNVQSSPVNSIIFKVTKVDFQTLTMKINLSAII